MSSIIAGLTKLPLSKILDIWGRPQGMALMLLIWTLGFIMMAACKNVFTYAAAQVFSTVGYVISSPPFLLSKDMLTPDKQTAPKASPTA